MSSTDASGGDAGGGASKSQEDAFKEFANGGGMQADVDELIAQFRPKIDKLRERVRDIVPQDDPQYDDLFYLRYVLSYKAKTTDCVEPIRFTIDYRAKYAEVFAKIHAEGVHAVPRHAEAMRFNCTGMCGTLPTGEPLWVVRTAHSMQAQLMNTLGTEGVSEWMTLSKEVQFHHCDQHTRRTRKLCKMISVIDMQGFKMGGSDRRFFKALGDSSKASAKTYPQLLGKTVIVNAPPFFRWMFKAFSVFQPKSAIEKMAICPVRKSEEKSAAECPWLSRLQGVDRVPPFLGGTAPLVAELEPFGDRTDALTDLAIKARHAAEPVHLDVPKGATVKWEVIVRSFGINVAFTFVPTGGEERALDIEGGEGGVIKVQAADGLTTGTFVVPEDGTVAVLFDNTHSFFRAKHLEYRLTLEDLPEDEAPATAAALVEDHGVGAAPSLPAATAAAAEEEEE